MGTFAKRLGFAGTAHARLTDVVVSDLDPARKPAVVEVAEIATGLPLEQATRIVDTHEPIECEDYIEAKVLREDLEAAGATVELRESVEELDERTGEEADEDARDAQASQVTNPAGLIVAAVGAAVLVVSAFLPYVDASALSFRTVAHNTLLQHGAWYVIPCALVVAFDALRAHQGKKLKLWAVLWAPALTVVLLVATIADSSNFRLQPLNFIPTVNNLFPPTYSGSPGIGLYVAIVGAVIAGSGLILSRNLALLAFARKKQCPDCAETVHLDAKVCKHCGFRFRNVT